MNLQLRLEAINKNSSDATKRNDLVELFRFDSGDLSQVIWLTCFGAQLPYAALDGLDSYYVKRRAEAALGTLNAYWRELDAHNPSNGAWGDVERFREFLTAFIALSEKFDQHHLVPVWRVVHI